jgi:hypothetical protein
VIYKLRDMLMNLPIVRILRGHRHEQCETECLKHTLKAEAHELARRVHVIEWQTFPHTHRQDEPRDDS